MKLKIESEKKPSGDQPKAIKSLVSNLSKSGKYQTLLGVTGSGKTFTAASVIEKYQKPTLVIAHNKTLAAQLAQEYKELFPNNAVHYFVSYYDYYQPEAYVPVTDTYIAKESMINKEIDRVRHATTQSLLTRDDVIVVASVSCIYGLGNPDEYKKSHIHIEKGGNKTREQLIKDLIKIYFERTNSDITPGKFRTVGVNLEFMPTNEETIYRVSFGKGIDKITQIDYRTREIVEDSVPSYFIFPAKHFVSDKDEIDDVLGNIKKELDSRLKELKKKGKVIEYERLKRKTLQDIALIREVGYCNGIENYSRHFDRREAGVPPYTLLSYFPKDFLTIIDESHVTIPQIGGMFAGDRSRKNTLVEHGFRLPSAVDNRPLTFEEFESKVGKVICTSATPGDYEMEESKDRIIEQIIRPTGLTDPEIEVRPIVEKGKYTGQVKDFIEEAKKEIKKKNRILVTTLTKKTAEDLSEYLREANLKAEYIHSDVKTIDRIEILTNFRKGEFDILVGVNLLREGLDLPEVTLVAIFDADKEGFLRSETSLIQTIGRAARNVDGRVILYADEVTGSLERSIEETERRRKMQIEYNKKNNITPRTIKKNIDDITKEFRDRRDKVTKRMIDFDMEEYKKNPKKFIKQKKQKMEEAVARLDFESAALLRDEIKELES